MVHKMDKQCKLDPAVLKSLFDIGYMGMEVDPALGGSGMSFLETLLVIEELARVDPSVAILVDIHNTLVNRVLMVSGSREQQERLLPRLCGEVAGAFALSESGSGSDAFALKTKAAKADGGWKLNGVKQWISSSEEAGLFIVFATADPAKAHKGIGCFVVEKGAKGLSLGTKYDKLGLRASSTCELVIDDVFVPDSNVIGEVGLGYKVAIESLNEGRIGIAAQMLGLAQGAFDIALPYIHERKQFGTVLADFQGMRFQFAELATQLEAARLLVYNAAALKEAGLPLAQEAAMAKIYTSRVAEAVASQCVEFLGGYGFTVDYGVEKLFRDSKIGSIYEGTTNVLLDTIAKQMQKTLRGQSHGGA
eukprot:Selendium_serpulae@DN4518_c0_g1_i1.p1